MTLNKEEIKARNFKQNEKRYGVSTVYGLPISSSIRELRNILKCSLEKKFQNNFNWNNLSNIHSTILRCKSKNVNIKNVVSLKFIIEIFKNISPFELSFDEIKLSSEGILRIHFKKIKSFKNINKKILKLFEQKNKISLNIIEEPWITVANLKYTVNNIDELKLLEELKRINCIANEVYKKILVRNLKVVNYEDITFKRKKIILVIKL